MKVARISEWSPFRFCKVRRVHLVCRQSEWCVAEVSPSYENLVTCLWCGQAKPQHEFSRSRRFKTGFAAHCRACHTAYERRRTAEIKAGTWNPTGQRTGVPNAVKSPSVVDIAWAAGFLEGEGHFRRSFSSMDRYGSERVDAAQVNPEPLRRLQEFFGGSIELKERRKDVHNDIFVWHVYGHRARTVMRAIEPFMSHRRREQVRRACERG